MKHIAIHIKTNFTIEMQPDNFFKDISISIIKSANSEYTDEMPHCLLKHCLPVFRIYKKVNA